MPTTSTPLTLDTPKNNNMGTKRKHNQMSAAPTMMLKPLQGAQIEAVTKTYNDLRAAGADSIVDLPATVVAGDTSSGKSSVMCRLTGLPFPRGEGVVTKFATEVEMMPADKEDISVTIRPDKELRSAHQQAVLLRFRRRIDLNDFEKTFTDACSLMESLGGRTLYADVLHISFKGPVCPPLTVIDLPGLIHAATQKVSDADRVLSETLAKRYLKEERTIVLPVISASNEIVNQAITRLTRAVDPNGARTLGIVTKVDTVCGKTKDTQLLNILSNEEIPLELGWHALVNLIETDEDATDEQITKAEQAFFKQPRFKALGKHTTGIDQLRVRVVQVVGEKLVNTLPALRRDVATKLDVAQANLNALGDPITDLGAQRKLLMRICSRFENVAQAEVNGVYSNDLLMQAEDISATAHKDTLRSEIEARHHDFVSAMLACGAPRKFHGLGASSTHNMSPGNTYKDWNKGSKLTSRAEAIDWAVKVQTASSRNGTSGSGNDQVVAQLFRELSKNWATLAHEHIDRLAAMCKAAIGDMLDRSTTYADDVADQIEDAWIHPHLDAKLDEVKATLDELWGDTFMTLKTYTPRLETLKELKIQELYREEAALANKPDSKKMTAIANLMHVIAYYEVDLEYWITAVVKQVAERFVRCIPKTLSSELVLELSNEQIKELMTESKILADKRKKTKDTVDTLQFALLKLDAQIKCLK